MYGQDNQWRLAGFCWKCKSDILFNWELDKYHFTRNRDMDCNCELAICGLCNKIKADIIKVPKIWKFDNKKSYHLEWRIAKEGVLICQECETDNFEICYYCEALLEKGFDVSQYCYANENSDEIITDPLFVCPDCWTIHKDEIRINRKLKKVA